MAVDMGGLSPADFTYAERTTIQFSEQEFSFLSMETTAEFDWKFYSPAVFRRIQALDNINYDDYMLLVRGYEILYEVSSSANPGSLHYMPHDDRLMIKTLKKSEVKLIKFQHFRSRRGTVHSQRNRPVEFMNGILSTFKGNSLTVATRKRVLLEMLPSYYRHVKEYGASLLTRFYGLHFVMPHRGVKVYYLVLSKILKFDQNIHLSYDLKGSSQGRSIDMVEFDQRPILKDLDLHFRFYLDPLTRASLLTQLKHDCEFLEAEGVMDYSLLLGVHIETSRQDSAKRETSDQHSAYRKTSHKGLADVEQSDASVVVEDLPDSGKDIESTPSSIGEPLARPDFKLGVKMPARAVRTSRDSNRGSMSPVAGDSNRGSTSSVTRRLRMRESNNVILYFGIIDILQDYGMSKRIERLYKSLQYDSKTISAVNPRAYSSRFQEFLGTVFQEESNP